MSHVTRKANATPTRAVYVCTRVLANTKGRQLFSVADLIDMRTAAGRLAVNVLLSVGQWEREPIAERTRDALQHKIGSGERCGKIRFG